MKFFKSALTTLLVVLFTNNNCYAQEEASPEDEALRNMNLGMAGLQHASTDPVLLAQLMKDLQNPEMMAEAKKMMDSPEFQKQMKKMSETGNFKDSMKKSGMLPTYICINITCYVIRLISFLTLYLFSFL